MAAIKNPINSYVSFWTRFLQVCKDNSLTVSPTPIPFQAKSEGENFLISLKEPIYLQDWKENSASKNNIDILLYGSETVAPKSIIIKSKVSVNYFDTSEKEKMILKPLQSVHYDYGATQAGHPVFHAQLSEGLIEESNRSDSFKKYQLEPAKLDDRLKGIRIPTAHLGLVSVLVGLIADHTGRITEKKRAGSVVRAIVLEKIIQDIRGIQKSPMACCNKASMKNDKDCSYSSMLWYPEFV